MGLETVELRLDIEKKFLISISDEDSAELGYVSDLAKYVSVRTNNSPKEFSYEEALSIIIDMLVSKYNVERQSVSSASHLIRDLGLD